MSQIPKIDTALRNFEDKIETATPDQVLDLIDQLRMNIEAALDELFTEKEQRLIVVVPDINNSDVGYV